MTPKKEDEDLIRLNLVVNSHVRDRLDRLQRLSGSESLTEVLRRALAVYEELLAIRGEGGQIVIEGREKREVLIII